MNINFYEAWLAAIEYLLERHEELEDNCQSSPEIESLYYLTRSTLLQMKEQIEFCIEYDVAAYDVEDYMKEIELVFKILYRVILSVESF